MHDSAGFLGTVGLAFDGTSSLKEFLQIVIVVDIVVEELVFTVASHYIPLYHFIDFCFETTVRLTQWRHQGTQGRGPKNTH